MLQLYNLVMSQPILVFKCNKNNYFCNIFWSYLWVLIPSYERVYVL
jgi:hypothetical protein